MKKTYWILIGLLCLMVFAFGVSADMKDITADTGDCWIKGTILGGGSPSAVDWASDSDNIIYPGGIPVNMQHTFLYFDLSELEPSYEFEISAIKLYIYGYTYGTMKFYVHYSDFGSTVVSGDFDGFETYEGTGSSEVTSWSTSSYNEITLNQDLIDYANENGLCSLVLVPSETNSDKSGMYFADTPLDRKPYINVTYTTDLNEPPEAYDFVNGSGNLISFCKPSFSAYVNDTEGDMINYSFWFNDGGGYEKVKYGSTYNGTVYFNLSDYDGNYWTCLGTTYYWRLRITDNESKESHIVNYTKNFVYTISPKPLENKNCAYTYYWKSVGNWNATDCNISEYRFVNDTVNYSWADAVSNDVVYNWTYYYNEDWEAWVFNNSVPSYDGVLVALNYSGFNIYHSVPAGGSSCEFTNKIGYANVSNGIYGDYFNISFDVDYDGTNINIDNESVSDLWLVDNYFYMVKNNDFGYTRLEGVNGAFIFNSGQISFSTATTTDSSDMTYNGYYNFTDINGLGFYLNHTYQLDFDDGVYSLISNNKVDNITGEGSGISFPLWYNFTNSNLTANVTCYNETNATLNYSINEDGWLYVSSLSLSPETILLILFIMFFSFGYSEKKRSAGFFLFFSGILFLSFSIQTSLTVGVLILIPISIPIALFIMFMGIRKWLYPMEYESNKSEGG